MRTAYLDCHSGISGDMMLGALVDAGADLAQLNAVLGSLGLPGLRLVAEQVQKNGFRATQVHVEFEPEHKHRHLHHITALIDAGQLSPPQKDLAKRIFTRLAEAEAKVHGTTIDRVHFHEVGAADSIADIVGAAVGCNLLGIERFVASPIPTGTGHITIAHGEVAIPAPATAELLQGVPLASADIPFELTTPTGAAILATLVKEFGPVPAMTIERIGCGAGQRDLTQRPNILRILVGETAQPLPAEEVWVVETNLDDATGELVGYCTGRLWEAGALDVTTSAVQMKKNRPGVTISVLCRLAELETIESILLAETTTLGVRRWPVSRRVLRRASHTVTTAWGAVEGKIGWLDGRARFSPEYESCRRVALERAVPLRDVYEAAFRAFDPANAAPEE